MTNDTTKMIEALKSQLSVIERQLAEQRLSPRVARPLRSALSCWRP